MLYSKIEGSGRHLLILHGFLGMSDNWKTLGTQFVADGFQVHLLDLRNHGRSFHSDEFGYEIMVQDVFDYCLTNSLESIDIIEHDVLVGEVILFISAALSEFESKTGSILGIFPFILTNVC